MSAAEWLREHVAGAPQHLHTAMLEALEPEVLGSIPDALAEGALRAYAKVLTGGGGREDAFPLLVADALLTHAFEAQAELDPEGMSELARRAGGAGHLGRLAT